MLLVDKNLFLYYPPARAMLTELRDRTTGRERVELLLKRLGYYLAMHATRGAPTLPRTVTTPLGPSGGVALDRCMIVPVLRAGLSLVPSFSEFLPEATILDLGLVRDEKTAIASVYLNKVPGPELVPTLRGIHCFVIDPMFATGGSACDAVQILKGRGANIITFAAILAAPEAIERMGREHPDVLIHVGRTDGGLNGDKYICGFSEEGEDGDGNGAGDIGDRFRGTVYR